MQPGKKIHNGTGEAIVLRYQRGLFLPEGGISSLDKLAREQQAQDIFIAILSRYDREGRNVSERDSANNFAPNVFRKEREAQGIRKELLDASMRRLFAAGKIQARLGGSNIFRARSRRHGP